MNRLPQASFVGAIHESPAACTAAKLGTKTSPVQGEVARSARGVVSFDIGRCPLESVGAIHESPAAGTLDKVRTKPPLEGG